jgi:hypothetical protein
MTAVSTAPPRLLRPATASDIEAIAALWHAGWREAHLGHVPAGLVQHRGLADLRDRVGEDLGAIRVVPGEAVVAANARARRCYARRGWVDAGPFAYRARAGAGTVTVAVHRYEKRVRP